MTSVAAKRLASPQVANFCPLTVRGHRRSKVKVDLEVLGIGSY
jgi:hypothetical protein